MTRSLDPAHSPGAWPRESLVNRLPQASGSAGGSPPCTRNRRCGIDCDSKPETLARVARRVTCRVHRVPLARQTSVADSAPLRQLPNRRLSRARSTRHAAAARALTSPETCRAPRSAPFKQWATLNPRCSVVSKPLHSPSQAPAGIGQPSLRPARFDHGPGHTRRLR